MHMPNPDRHLSIFMHAPMFAARVRLLNLCFSFPGGSSSCVRLRFSVLITPLLASVSVLTYSYSFLSVPLKN